MPCVKEMGWVPTNNSNTGYQLHLYMNIGGIVNDCRFHTSPRSFLELHMDLLADIIPRIPLLSEPLKKLLLTCLTGSINTWSEDMFVCPRKLEMNKNNDVFLNPDCKVLAHLWINGDIDASFCPCQFYAHLTQITHGYSLCMLELERITSLVSN